MATVSKQLKRFCRSTVLLLLVLAAGALSAPGPALAQDGWDSLDFRTTHDDCGPYSVGKYEARDSSVSYCMNQERFGPSEPGGPWLTYSSGWVWLDDAYGAVVCNGYPVSTSFGGYSLSADRARAATQIAVWMLNGTTNTNGSYSYASYDGKTHTGAFTKDPEVTAAARWLCESARSGAITAAPHRARRYIGPVSGTQRQDMLYVLPTVSASFEKHSSDISITTGNDSYSLADARFDIYEEASGARVASIRMDAQGRATATLLPNTAYYLVETAAPQGYVARGDHIRFTTGGNGGLTSIDEAPGTVSLSLIKADAATGGSAQPGASLAGAEFTCTSQSAPGWTRTLTTDDAGRASLAGIPLGTFTIRETKAPEGYLPSNETWTYTVGPDQLSAAGTVELECRIPNTPIAFDLEISKFKDGGGDSSGLEQAAGGVRFEVISNTTHATVGELTTNVYGFASTADDATTWFGAGTRPEGVHGAVPYDRAGYTIHEVEATVPAGFAHVGDWTVDADQLADGAKLQYIVDNHALLTHLQIVKRDATSGLTVPLAGFTFQLLDAELNPISQTCWYPNHVVADTFTTDETGTVTLPGSLTPGTYYIREIKLQAPYLTAEDLKIEIPADQTLAPVSVASVYDERAVGEVSITKTDAQSGSPLTGATFDIRAVDTIAEPDGRVAAVAGETVATITTGEDGKASASDLSLGSGSAIYEVVETRAPEGYLLDTTPHPFTLTYLDSSTRVVTQTLDITDDFTKLEISKVDITGTSELEGAHLELVSDTGEVIESWTSSGEPHRIEHLAPGSYTLRETRSPRTYDMAEEVAFELKPTGEVQTVQVKDAPLKISGQIDKRQEIAHPGEGLDANADGLNRATTQRETNGVYSYTLDFRNTSGTWVDECAVTDELKAASAGAAELVSITTPIAPGDRNGLVNVWYRTNVERDDEHASAAEDKTDSPETTTEEDNGPIDASSNDDENLHDGEYESGGTDSNQTVPDLPNATLDDGHDNPWLNTDEVTDLIGEDGRRIDYTGWRLWKADVPTKAAETLRVSDLKLEKNERIIAIRFEYGCVDKDFSTRPDTETWTRDDLKDEHDDIESATTARKSSEDAGGDSSQAAPAIITMRALAGYNETTPLENSAQIDLTRNGGGDDLEDHDSDRVIQRCAPKLALPGTGSLPVAALMCALITTGGALIFAIACRRNR